jgi:uncharacterized membrane protein
VLLNGEIFGFCKPNNGVLVISRLIKGIQLGLLIAAYPVIIYLLISSQAAWLGVLLVFTMITWKLRHRDNWLWWILALALLALLSIRLFGIDAILKMSPLLIHTSLFSIFLQSLKTTPLIERFARLDFGDALPPGIAAYCRKVTILWTGFFAANIVGNVWLAIRGNADAWVLYNGLIVYLLVGALLLGEYLWRRIAFPDLEIPSLTHTVRSMINNGHKIWEQEKHDGV